MITIERAYDKFKMRFKQAPREGFTVHASDLAEIIVALDHYYKGHVAYREDCPICRKFREGSGTP